MVIASRKKFINVTMAILIISNNNHYEIHVRETFMDARKSSTFE